MSFSRFENESVVIFKNGRILIYLQNLIDIYLEEYLKNSEAFQVKLVSLILE